MIIWIASKNLTMILTFRIGYGWSDAPHETQYDVKDVAKTFSQLMGLLEYSRYGVQGGDWGNFENFEQLIHLLFHRSFGGILYGHI